MSTRPSICLLLLVALISTIPCLGSPTHRQKNPATLSNDDIRQLSVIKSRLETTDLANWLSGAFWALIHNSESKKDSDNLIELFGALSEYFSKHDDTRLIAFGGVKAVKERIAGITRSSDDTARGVAALLLGVIGDKEYAPAIAILLKDPAQTNQTEKSYRDPTVAGIAAVALGLLGATDYIPQIVLLLKSSNDYYVSCALQGLSYLMAKEHAKEMAGFLGSERHGVAESAIRSLVKMGVANQYKTNLVGTMLGQGDSEARKTAMFALARIGATDRSADIAILLDDRFLKEEAAMALALLNSTEFEGKIAKLLKDESSLARKSAALSLGIMRASQYAGEVAKLLNDSEDFVRYYAGVSLVLMRADSLAVKAIPMIEETHRQHVYLNITDFDSLVEPEFLQIKSRFEKALAELQSRNQKRKP